MHKQKKLADIGLIRLAPMGKALAYNLRECGYDVALYNRSIIKTEELKGECEDKDNDLEDYDIKNHKEYDVIEDNKDNDVEDNKDDYEEDNNIIKDHKDNDVKDHMDNDVKGSFIYTYNLEEFISKLKKPRMIISIIKSTGTIKTLTSINNLLHTNDYFMDFSNSTPDLTDENARACVCNYAGIGISCGTAGARKNGGMMVGCSTNTYQKIQPVLLQLSNSIGYFGNESAGHFVKMVHNAIEYALMGVIVEFYEVMKKLKRVKWMYKWNEEIKMYLIDVVEKVCKNERFKDVDGKVDMKGTGLWVHNNRSGESTTVLLGCAIDQRISSTLYNDRRFNDKGNENNDFNNDKGKDNENKDFNNDNDKGNENKNNINENNNKNINSNENNNKNLNDNTINNSNNTINTINNSNDSKSLSLKNKISKYKINKIKKNL